MEKLKTIIKLLLIANVILIATSCSNNNDKLATKEQVRNLKEYADQIDSNVVIKNEIGYGMTVQNIIDTHQKLLESSIVSHNEIEKLKTDAIDKEVTDYILEKVHYGMTYAQYREVKETVDNYTFNSYTSPILMALGAIVLNIVIGRIIFD
ncbi:hypothetical protein L3V86_09415 [Thiotrichales bacterium 19S11-10]|nr:hypothetical protein [Thiotrichales bacterium 19S11-10]